jgi:large subunit ribosomal protein L4
MAKIDVFKQDGSKAKAKLDLDDAVFGVDVKEHLLYAAVRYQLAKRRQGTHDTKERAEVRGGGAKPWRQKGTGRARQGTRTAPQWRGGGTVFGPTPRDHSIGMNKKERRGALCSALSQRAKNGDLIVLDDLAFDAPKTRQVVDLMKAFELGDALVVIADRDDNVERSANNHPDVTVIRCEGVNVYDVLLRSKLVMTKSAVEAVTNRLTVGG